MEAFLLLVIIAVAFIFIAIVWAAYEVGRKAGWTERSDQYLSQATLDKIRRNPDQYRSGE